MLLSSFVEEDPAIISIFAPSLTPVCPADTTISPALADALAPVEIVKDPEGDDPDLPVAINMLPLLSSPEKK